MGGCGASLNHERQRFAFAVRRHSLSKPFKYFAKLIARRRRTEIPYDPHCVTLFEYRSDLAEVGVEHRLETGNVRLASQPATGSTANMKSSLAHNRLESKLPSH